MRRVDGTTRLDGEGVLYRVQGKSRLKWGMLLAERRGLPAPAASAHASNAALAVKTFLFALGAEETPIPQLAHDS